MKKWFKKFTWFFIGITASIIYAFLKGLFQKQKNGKLEKQLNHINTKAEQKLFQMDQEQEKIKNKKEADKNEINNMSDTDLIDELKHHSQN